MQGEERLNMGRMKTGKEPDKGRKKGSLKYAYKQK